MTKDIRNGGQPDWDDDKFQDEWPEMGFSSAGAEWDGFKVISNELIDASDWRYTRRVVFSYEDRLWQFDFSNHHQGGEMDWTTPYEVEAYQETVTKYRKPDSGNQADRPVQRTPLPATVAPLRGWPDHC